MINPEQYIHFRKQQIHDEIIGILAGPVSIFIDWYAFNLVMNLLC